MGGALAGMNNSVKNSGHKTIFCLFIFGLVVVILLDFRLWLSEILSTAKSTEKWPRLSTRTELVTVVTSLIGSGSELLKPMFQNANDWNYFETSADDPIYDLYRTLEHVEEWETTEKAPDLVHGWLESLLDHPRLHQNNNPASWVTSQTNKELTLLNANLGTWNFKHKFLSQKFGENSRFVHFVRDPRS